MNSLSATWPGLAAVMVLCIGAAPADGAATESRESPIDPEVWPLVNAPDLRDPEVERRVTELLASMTLEEKVGQLIQADIGAIEPRDLLTYRLGSILNGGNSAPRGDNHAHPSEYLTLADAFYDASVDTAGGKTAIPVIWGTDAVHGHSNIVGATVFPHNIGLGAARNPELIRDIGTVTARETQVTGMDWTFAPTVAVVRDDRWGRTYESYGEDPEIVAQYAGMMVEGLQGAVGTEEFLRGEHIIATAKHYLGDGGTSGGVDQGDNPATEAELRDVHAPGYPAAIRAGVQTVMASFNSWHGDKLHGHRGLLTDVLVGRMGFDGFVVGDWNGHGQVSGCSNASCARSFNAGVDMAMAPDSWKALYHNTLEQAKRGEISTERLDQAVARVLRVKVRYDVFGRGRPSTRPNAGNYSLLGAPAHRAVARRAVRQSLVLLKNNDRLLPLDPRTRILVAGDAADDIGRQSGGWTLTWQGEGNTNEDFPNGQSIFAGLREAIEAAGGKAVLAADGHFTATPDAAIVVFGERPYAEFQGDRQHLDFDDDGALAIMRRLRDQGIPVIAVFLSGRPMYVTPEINAADAFVAAWLPGTEGGGVADVLLRGPEGELQHDFRGKLSFSWPRHSNHTPLNRGDDGYDPLFAYGYGLTYADDTNLPALREFENADRQGNAGDYVRAGRVRTPYRMVLVSGAETMPVDGPTAATPDGTVRIQAVDRDAQEDARQITWQGPGRFAVRGTRQDLTRESNAQMVLTFSYRVIRTPSGRVRVGVDCAGGCDGLKDLTAEFQAASGAGWRTAEVPLAELGVDVEGLRAVVAPFVLESDGPFQIQLSDVSLSAPGLLLVPVAGRAAGAAEPRIMLPLDSGWRFHRDDVPAARNPAFDDDDWSIVTLPHTYNGADGEDGGGYYRGPAWYRRVIELSEPTGARRLARRRFLQFDGAALIADVYVNGRFAGRHEGGYARFRFDITDLLQPGQNHIAVRVDNTRAAHIAPLGGDFTVFGGLFRGVSLLDTGAIHVDALDYGGPGVYVSTNELAPDTGAELVVTTRVRNDREQPAHAVVVTTIADAEGTPVSRLRSPVRVPPESVAVVPQRARVERPRLWRGIDDPYLYRAVTEIMAPGAAENAAVLDRVDTSFGIRTVDIDPQRGFLLNGVPVPVHGVNLFHSGRPGRGLAVTDAEIRADMATLEALGVTAVRFVHFQHAPLAYDEADRRGFIVWTEIPLNGAIDQGQAFERNIARQMRELIRQNFNHPSVAVWGLGNEVYSTSPAVERVLKRVQQVAKEEDPARPTAYAHCCQADDHPKALVSDVSAFNRYFGWYPDQQGSLGAWAQAFHHKHPKRAFAVAEFGAGASIRHQQDPPVQPTPASGWHPEQYQALFHERSWRQLMGLDHLWGKFVWVAFDLASDGRSEGDRPGINDKGLVTYDRAVRKDAFYWYQANWSDDPVLHLTSKRAVLRTTPEVDIKAYTNARAVVLRVNGRKTGTAPAVDHIARWSGVPLQPGSNRIEIEARAQGGTLRDEAYWEYSVLPADLTEVLKER